jgi:hypothetical protein
LLFASLVAELLAFVDFKGTVLDYMRNRWVRHDKIQEDLFDSQLGHRAAQVSNFLWIAACGLWLVAALIYVSSGS